MAVNDDPLKIDRKYNNFELSVNHNLILSSCHQCLFIVCINWNIDINIGITINIMDEINKIIYTESVVINELICNDKNISDTISKNWSNAEKMAAGWKKSLIWK